MKLNPAEPLSGIMVVSKALTIVGGFAGLDKAANAMFIKIKTNAEHTNTRAMGEIILFVTAKTPLDISIEFTFKLGKSDTATAAICHFSNRQTLGSGNSLGEGQKTAVYSPSIYLGWQVKISQLFLNTQKRKIFWNLRFG